MREFEHTDEQLLAKQRLLKVDKSAVINVAPSVVWDVVSDHWTWPTWHDDYEEHDALTDQTTGLGATFGSREWWLLRSESEITRWEDGRLVGLTVRRATFWRWLVRKSYTEIEVVPSADDDQRCEVHYRSAFSGTALFWLLSGYSVAHALAGLHWTARSVLKKLDETVHTSR